MSAGDIVGILVASAFPILAFGVVVLFIVTAWRS